MSSRVETSRVASREDSQRDSSTPLGMTESTFATLGVYHDDEPRPAALNMALDEALLESVTVPTIRFYRWHRPSLSFGYFGRYVDVAPHESEREIVRRWTGGGTVLHGGDLTYSLIIPAEQPLFARSSAEIYLALHEVIRTVLNVNGATPTLAKSNSANNSHECFAKPVRGDVLIAGRKVAGAAQRRTRVGILHQGSIQHDALPDRFTDQLAGALGNSVHRQALDAATIQRAQMIADRKYGTVEWLRRR